MTSNERALVLGLSFAQVVVEDSLSGRVASRGIPWIHSTNRPTPWS